MDYVQNVEPELSFHKARLLSDEPEGSAGPVSETEVIQSLLPR